MRTLSLFLLSVTSLIAAGKGTGVVTQPDQLKVPPGFKVELLREAGPDEGSWICMTEDDKGRLYISTQGSNTKEQGKWGGIWRAKIVMTEEPKGNSQSHVLDWEKVNVPVGDAMGMLWAFDSLYVSGMGPQGRGIYRCTSSKHDDHLDYATLFKAIPGGAGEHGAHAIVLGPDKKLYIINGNSTGILDGLAPDSPYRHWGEDDLLPRLRDPVATFFDKIKAPYGCVYRTDADGTKWELFAGGFRNPYDIAFNPDGELFTYDADMEWDRGLPWYRPTRILHVVPGGEYGFREGSAKWPAYFPDSLPAVADIGVGCPTGMKFGTDAKGWPEKYRRALFLHDWTYGRILAVTLHQKGASYTARNELASYTYPRDAEANGDVEVFLSGKGMPVTDMEFLRDGSMVFTVGGRGTAAALYRVSYAGKADARIDAGDEISELRAKLDRMKEELEKMGIAPEKEPTSPPLLPAELAAKIERTKAQSRESLAQIKATERRIKELLANAANLAPEAQRKLAGGAASEASATTGSPSAKASAPDGARENSAPPEPTNFTARSKRSERPSIAGGTGSGSVAWEWPWLDGECPSLQYEARRAIELIPVEKWRDKTLHENNPEQGLTALLALARVGTNEDLERILTRLAKFPIASLDEDQKLLKLRILELSFARQGRPSEERVKALMEELLALHPVPTNHRASQRAGERVDPGRAGFQPAAPGILPGATDVAKSPQQDTPPPANPPDAPRADGRKTTPDGPGKIPGPAGYKPALPARDPAAGAPVDDPAWRLNRELCALLVWLSNPELGELNSALVPKAGGDGGTPAKPANAPKPAPAGAKSGIYDQKRHFSSLRNDRNDIRNVGNDITRDVYDIRNVSNDIMRDVYDIRNVGNDIMRDVYDIRNVGNDLKDDAHEVRNDDNEAINVAGDIRRDVSQVIGDEPETTRDVADAIAGASSPSGTGTQPLLLAQAAPAAAKADTLPSEAPPVIAKPLNSQPSTLNSGLGPVPNPGADIFPGRKGAAFHAELGRQGIEKTLALMDAAPSQEEQVWYAFCLRWAHGWTPEQRVRYFRWFHEKTVRYTGGNSFVKFAEAIRADAASRVPESDRAALADWLRPLASPRPAVLKPRAFVKAWTLPELEAALDKLKDRKPDLARGKDLYTQAQCAQCHLFRDAGGNVGPDLTAVAQRFGRHDILESITDPSKVIGDQYAMITLTVLDGKGGTSEVSGLVKEETSATVTILTDPLAGKTSHFYKNVIVKREKAAVSIMPPGLLYTLTAEEVADLIGFLGAK